MATFDAPTAGGPAGDASESEKRRQKRYPFHTEAVLERATGEKLNALTVNLSGGGALLEVPMADLKAGETVTCGVKLYEDRPPQSWGAGRIVRVQDSLVAIDFQDVQTSTPD